MKPLLLLSLVLFVAAQTSLERADKVATAFVTLTEPLWYYATGLSAPILAGVEECSLNRNQTAILGTTLVNPEYSLAERQPLIDKFQNATSKLEDISEDFVYYYSKLF